MDSNSILNSNVLNGVSSASTSVQDSSQLQKPLSSRPSRWDDKRPIQKAGAQLNNVIPQQTVRESLNHRTGPGIEPIPSTSKLPPWFPTSLPAKPSSTNLPPPLPSTPAPSPPPPPPSFLTSNSSKQVIPKSIPPISAVPTVLQKMPGTRDYFVTYDPALDSSSVKKGKELIFRYDGAGLDATVLDPRRKSVVPVRSSKSKTLLVKTVTRLNYAWDRNSTGAPPPAPPSAIIVTGLPATTTADQIHRFFTVFGRIETQQVKTDKSTGGSLGVCWIKFVDDVPRVPDPEIAIQHHYEREKKKGMAQNGNAVAEAAVLKGNGSKIGTSMLMGSVGVQVAMDGDGSKCKKIVEAELLKRHPPKQKKPTISPMPSTQSKGPSSNSTPIPRMPLNLPPPPIAPRMIPPPSAPPNSYTPSPSIPSGPRALRNDRSSISQTRIPPSALHDRLPIVPSVPSTYKGSAAPTTMSLAIAAAVKQARKRLEETQNKQTAIAERKDKGEIVESSEESASEEEKEEKVFFSKDSKRGTLQRSQGGFQQASKPGNMSSVTNSVAILSTALVEEKLVGNAKAFLEISKNAYRQSRGSRADIEESDLWNRFRRFDVALILADENSWYLSFTRYNSASLALAAFARTPFAGAPLPLILRNPLLKKSPLPPLFPPAPQDVKARVEIKPRVVNVVLPPTGDLDDRIQLGQQKFLSMLASMGPKKPKKVSGWTDEELVEEAKEIIMEELLASFRKDVTGRVISAKIMERVENAGNVVKMEIEESVSSIAPAVVVKALPSFSKKKLVNGSGKSKDSKASNRKGRNSSEVLSDDTRKSHQDSEEEERSDSSPKKGRRILTKKSTRKVIKSDEDSSDFDLPSSRAKSQNGFKKKGKLRVEVTFTTSEEEGEINSQKSREVESIPPEKEDTPLTTEPSPEPVVDIKMEEVVPQISFQLADLPALPLSIPVVIPAPVQLPLPLPPPPPPPTPPIVKVAPLPRIIEIIPPPPIKFFNPDPEPDSSSDESIDEEFLPLVAPLLPILPPLPLKLIPRQEPKSLIVDPFEEGLVEDAEDLYYLKLAIERPRLNLPPELDYGQISISKHSTGSARTEGFYVVSAAEKLANRLKSVETKIEKPKVGESGVAVSRMARANVRGLVRGMELQKKLTANDTDVLKFNQLRTRKKMLSFSRSGIHDYGLFSLEHIPAGEMVIEYVGELVRQQVADRREKAYERQGIGSSYLFRVDEDLVVDATKKGNLGRLINHCCVPNCNARIITISGEKKIVIYAKTSIERGDEVTYDYHFPHEEIKIPCLCGHPLCRKYLN